MRLLIQKIFEFRSKLKVYKVGLQLMKTIGIRVVELLYKKNSIT